MSPVQKSLIVFSVLFVFMLNVQAQQAASQGQISVSDHGTLIYTLPIRVPSGAGRLQPNLTMQYESVGTGNARGGWSLTGLPRIMRCPKTLAQDGVRMEITYTSADAFCLDGERLIPIVGVNGADGTEYRTERDTYAKIVSVGNVGSGPNSFNVYTKSGLQMIFGGNARILGASGGPVKGWALFQIMDSSGNRMAVTYTNLSPGNQSAMQTGDPVVDDGIYYPTKIDYSANSNVNLTGNATAHVQFGWTALYSTEPNIKYESGRAIPHGWVIAGITGSYQPYGGSYTSYSSYNFARDNAFSYSQPSGPNGGDPYPPIRLSMSDGGGSALVPVSKNYGYEPIQDNAHAFQSTLSWNAFPGTLHDYQDYFADIDGNGKKSWIRISQAADEAWVGTARVDGTFTSSQWLRVSSSVGSMNDFDHYFADVDGDGKADWIRVSRTTNEAWVALGQGGGAFQFWTKYLPGVGSVNSTAHYFIDLNGDGRIDWVQISRTADVVKVGLAAGGGDFPAWTLPAQQFGLSTRISYFADVNGDGKVDWLTLAGNMLTPYLSNGDGTFTAGTATYVGPGTCTFADVNGDKNADAICVSPINVVLYSISNGDGTFQPQVNLGTASGSVRMSDVNADGMFDRIVTQGCAWTQYWPATGDNGANKWAYSFGMYSFPSAPALNSSADCDYYFEDINGDGKPDLILVDRANRTGFVALNQLNNINRITSFSDDVRGTTTIQYKPLSDPSVYTTDADGAYPLRDAIFPLTDPTARMPYVVASVISPDGKGGTVTTRYTYGGMKTDVLRNQNLGFRWMKATQVESGITTFTEFKQVWPFTGLVSKVTTTGPSGVTLRQMTNTYDCTDFVSASGCTVTPGHRYFPYLTQSVTAAWDANGVALPTTTQTYQYDIFGNVTHTVTSSSDGYSKTVDTTYMNDTTKWWIGRPTRTTVTNTSP